MPPATAGLSTLGDRPASRSFTTPTILIILAVHVAIGVGGALSPMVATAHAAITVAVTLAVIVGTRRPELIVAVAAYGGVCDVYWRMTRSSAPWEISKYLLALGAVALLVRFIRGWPRGTIPIVFLALLVPGMLLATLGDGVSFARDNISGYEMGLVSFGLGALAFRHLIGNRTDAWNLGWIVVGPLVAALAVTTYSLVTSPDLDFSSESSFTATGGYGPNQVSSTLGLIMLICVLLAFLPPARRVWPVLTGLGLWSVWGTFLTFSRGGIYSLVLAGGAMLLVGVSTRGARTRSIITLAVTGAAMFIIFASANDFAGSWLEERYQDSGTAGRSTIAELDLEVFAAHPLTGVGSGRAFEFRGQGRLAEAAAHTEFTRVLAEHGLFGLGALLLLATMLVQAYREGLCYWNRLMIVALSVWSLTTMLHAATRIGAVAVMLALTQLRVEDSPARQEQAGSRH